MDSYLWLKLIHIICAVVVVGTGAGIAFFMLMTSRTDNLEVIAATTRLVVKADWLFTAPAVLIQAITGVALISTLGYSFTSSWTIWVFSLYAIIVLCWLPVVGIQYKLRAIATESLRKGVMDPAFARWMRIWTLLGIPAFCSVLGLLYLMVFKPLSVL